MSHPPLDERIAALEQRALTAKQLKAGRRAECLNIPAGAAMRRIRPQ